MVTMPCYFPSLEEECFLDSAEIHFARNQNILSAEVSQSRLGGLILIPLNSHENILILMCA